MTWDEVRQEAFGEIGLLPDDFYLMEKEDYWLLHRGFLNKRVYEERLVRHSVFTLITPHIKNPPNYTRDWPILFDDEFREQSAEYNKDRKIRVSNASLLRLAQLREQEEKRKQN